MAQKFQYDDRSVHYTNNERMFTNLGKQFVNESSNTAEHLAAFTNEHLATFCEAHGVARRARSITIATIVNIQ